MRARLRRRVAACCPARYTARLRDTCRVLLLATSAAACAPRAPGAGLPVDSALVAEASAAAGPSVPLHVTFDWSLRDPDGRFSGQGVVRIAPPWRARLDLFGPRGEGYLSAVLDEEELVLPPGADAALLPPAAFLWATLGAFRKPGGTTLEVAHRTDGRVELGFRGAQEHWRFRLTDGQLRHVEWEGPDGGRRTVQLEGSAAHGMPARGVYRDWLAYRELTLSVITVEQVDGFPDEIWYPGTR